MKGEVEEEDKLNMDTEEQLKMEEKLLKKENEEEETEAEKKRKNVQKQN